jgi:hypothetical protein
VLASEEVALGISNTCVVVVPPPVGVVLQVQVYVFLQDEKDAVIAITVVANNIFFIIRGFD